MAGVDEWHWRRAATEADDMLPLLAQPAWLRVGVRVRARARARATARASLAARGVKSESEDTRAKPSMWRDTSCTRSTASIAIAMSELPLPLTMANCAKARNESVLETSRHGCRFCREKSP